MDGSSGLRSMTTSSAASQSGMPPALARARTTSISRNGNSSANDGGSLSPGALGWSSRVTFTL